MHEEVTVTMTRAEVIKAIEVETKLRPGCWIQLPMHGGEPNERNCSVCAFGAVLWEGAVPPEKINEVADALVLKSDLLADLSYTFESTFGRTQDIENARRAAMEYVRAHFPRVIRFKYDGENAWLVKDDGP